MYNPSNEKNEFDFMNEIFLTEQISSSRLILVRNSSSIRSKPP
jgi:hypothetical protein